MTSSPGQFIGPFAVTHEVERQGRGSLFRAHDPAGRPILLVAVRAVSAATRAALLADASTPSDRQLLSGDGPDTIWAVFPPDRTDQARALLTWLAGWPDRRDTGSGGPAAAIGPAASAWPASAPEFEPAQVLAPPTSAINGGGMGRSDGGAGAVTSGSSRPGRVAFTVGAVVVVLALSVGGIVLANRPTAPASAPTYPTHTPVPLPIPTPLRPAPPSPLPSPGGPVPTPSQHPLPTPGKRPDAPMLQQQWQPGDKIYPMDLPGFTFSFRAPGDWGCMRSSKAGVRWVCGDETGILGGHAPANPGGGIIESDECSAPCGPAAYADVLARLKALDIDTSGLQTVNNRTRISTRLDPSDPNRTEYRMSRTYDSDGDGTLDRHLWVRIDANPGDQVGAEKMIGDLYDATR